jgi:hypothetical protein
LPSRGGICLDIFFYRTRLKRADPVEPGQLQGLRSLPAGPQFIFNIYFAWLADVFIVARAAPGVTFPDEVLAELEVGGKCEHAEPIDRKNNSTGYRKETL